MSFLLSNDAAHDLQLNYTNDSSQVSSSGFWEHFKNNIFKDDLLMTASAMGKCKFRFN